MSDLPPGWSWATVGSVAESLVDGPFGSNLKTEHYQSNGVRVIRLQNIADGQFNDTDKAYISEERAKALSRHDARPGDVLIAAMGDVLPRACLVPRDVDWAIVKADCFRLRPRKGVLPQYLAYMLSAPQTRKLASTQIAGVGRPRLNLKKVSALTIPLPPEQDQARIVAAIEEQFSRLEAGSGSLMRARKNLSIIQSSIIQESVTGDWPVVPFSQLIDSLKNGIFVSRPVTEPGGQAILRISSVRPMNLNISDIRYVPRGLNLKNIDNYLVNPGDLLFTRYSGSPELVGACAMVPNDAGSLLHPDKLIRVKVNRSVAEPRFIELAASVGLARREIGNRVKTTAGQTGISGADLKSVPFALPPIEVQRRIIEKVDRLFDWIRQVQRSAIDADVRTSGLRSSILAAAFSGKLI